jgi:O-glycosyl hydrolase
MPKVQSPLLLFRVLRGFSAALMLFTLSAQAQTVVFTNYTFDTSASASPPAWGVWPNGIGNYVTNGWSSSDVSNNPASGSLLITSTFTGASQQSVVWSGQSGDFNPPLNGALITNFSCYIRFDPSSPTNASTSSYGSIAFYLNTIPHGAYPPGQIGGYYSVPAGNTNWVFFSVPVNTNASVYGITIQLETYGNSLNGTSKMYVDNIQLTGVASLPPVSGLSSVNWNNVFQRIDGFGASSAWGPTWTTAEADLLFSTNNSVVFNSVTYHGAGLSLLRNHIAYGSTTSASETLSTVETSIMQMAQARGAKVWSAPWTPAAGFKATNDIYDTNHAYGGGINGGSYLGSGNNITNVNYASQLANYVASMKNTYGVNLYAISVQNEPDANVTNYEACQWTGAQVHDFVTNLYSALAAQGLSSTKIILPESENWSGTSGLYTPTLNDPNAAACVSIVANHNYVANNGVGDQTTPAALSVSGKALWETEVALLSGNDSSIANGVYYAQRIHLFMTQAQANAYHYWWLVATGNQGLLDTSAGPAKRLFTFGQYSRFVRPNFNRIGATSSQSSALISAYKDSTSPAFAIVVVNTSAAADVIQTFNLTNFTTASVTPWITSGSLSLSPQSPVTVTNSSFTYTVPAMSVVTFAGQADLPPTNIALSALSVQENLPAGTAVGTFSTADPAPGNTFTYSLVSGSGSSDNSKFSLAGNSLLTASVLDAALQNTVNIRVRSTDQLGLFLEQTFSLPLVLSNQARKVLSIASSPGGNASMTFSGIPGQTYHVLAATSLSPPIVWTPMTNILNGTTNFSADGTGLWNYTDLYATNLPTRFYRSVEP